MMIEERKRAEERDRDAQIRFKKLLGVAEETKEVTEVKHKLNKASVDTLSTDGIPDGKLELVTIFKNNNPDHKEYSYHANEMSEEKDKDNFKTDY